MLNKAKAVTKDLEGGFSKSKFRPHVSFMTEKLKSNVKTHFVV